MAEPNTDESVQNLQTDPSQPAQPTQDATQAMSSQLPPSQNPTPGQTSPNDAAAVKNAATPQEGTPDYHASLFHKIMGVMAGGERKPVLDDQGNPVTGPDGKVKTQPMTTKNLGAGILAGALASMMAGFQHLPERDGNGVMRTHLNEAAAAGAEAGKENSSQARLGAIQNMSDQNRLRSYQTMKQNMDLHASSLALDRLDDEAKQRTIDKYAPLRQSIPAGLKLPDGSSFIVDGGEDVGEDEMQKLMASGAGPTSHSAMPTGMRMNPATGKNEMTWTVFNNQGQIPITAENAKQYGFEDAAIGHSVPISVFMKHAQNQAVRSTGDSIIENIGRQVDEFNAAQGNKAPKSKVTLDDIIKQAGPSYNSPTELAKLQAVAGMAPDKAVDAIRKGGDNRLAAVVANAFGIDEDKYAQQRQTDLKTASDKAARELRVQEASDKAATPEGQAALQEKRLQIQKLQSDLAAQDLASAGLDVPQGFKLDANAMQMAPTDLQAHLASQGVQMPANYQALYAIGHNAADLKTLPTQNRKGVSAITQAQGLSWIRQYVNPQYQEGDYSAAAGLSKELASTKQNTAGGTLYNAGTASQHLELLAQAAEALKNQDVQAVNRLANMFGVAVGKSPAVTFQAIADQANGEVAKVVAGGKPNEPELQALRNQLNTDQSPEQTQNVIKAYIGLMGGRVNEINDRSQQYFGRDVKGISPATRRVFKKYGVEIPGDEQAQQPRAAIPTAASSNGPSQAPANANGHPNAQWTAANGHPIALVNGKYIDVTTNQEYVPPTQ